MEEAISQIKTQYLEKISKADSLEALDTLYLVLFGKSGLITLIPKKFPKLDKETLRIVAPLFNTVKNELEEAISSQRSAIREESYKQLEKEVFDENGKVEIKERKG